MTQIRIVRRPIIGRWFAIAMILAFFALFVVLVSPTLAQDVTATVEAPAETVTPEATLVVVEPTVEAPVIIDQPIDDPVVEPPTGTNPIFDPPSPLDVFNGTLLAFFSYFVSRGGSPLTAAVVSLLKRVPYFGDVVGTDEAGNPLYRFNAHQLNLGVAMFLSVLVWGAAALGLSNGLNTIFELLLVSIPVLTGAGGNFIGNQKVYEWGKRKHVPILGYSRPETVTLQSDNSVRPSSSSLSITIPPLMMTPEQRDAFVNAEFLREREPDQPPATGERL